MNQFPVAVVLAGGVGKRFAPFITDKSLFPFLGQPLIWWTLSQLAEVGFSKVVVIANPTNQSAISAFKFKTLQVTTILQSQPLGMADAILQARTKLADSKAFILNAGSLVTASLYQQLLPVFQTATAGLVATKPESYFPGGYLKFRKQRPIAVIEKPGPGHEPSPYLVQVFYYFKNLTDFLPLLTSTHSTKDDLFERAYTRYLSTHPVQLTVYSGDLSSFKYPWHILSTLTFLLKHQLTPSLPSNLPPDTIIDGPVFIHPQAKLYRSVIINGPAYIGPGVTLGDRTTIRDSIIETNSLIGSNSEIVRSYIGPNCQLHGAFVGDSALEDQIHLAYGTILANLRLDHHPISVTDATGHRLQTDMKKLGSLIASGVSIGVNSQVMPGTIITPHQAFLPGSNLKGYCQPDRV